MGCICPESDYATEASEGRAGEVQMIAYLLVAVSVDLGYVLN